jgi:hypothetical protein
LKEEALDRTMWRARFGRGFGPVVRQTTEWMIYIYVYIYIYIYHRTVYQLKAVPKCHNWRWARTSVVFQFSEHRTVRQLVGIGCHRVSTSSLCGGLPTPMILPSTSESYWHSLPRWTA